MFPWFQFIGRCNELQPSRFATPSSTTKLISSCNLLPVVGNNRIAKLVFWLAGRAVNDNLPKSKFTAGYYLDNVTCVPLRLWRVSIASFFLAASWRGVEKLIAETNESSNHRPSRSVRIINDYFLFLSLSLSRTSSLTTSEEKIYTVYSIY